MHVLKPCPMSDANMNQDGGQRDSTLDSAPPSEATPAVTTAASRMRNPYAAKLPAVTLKDRPKPAPQPFPSSKEVTAVPPVLGAAERKVESIDPPIRAQGPTGVPLKPAAAEAAGSETKNTTSYSTYTPYWERLPSRNLSFGSAEILTVTECLVHSTLYQNKPVRVTGLVHRRSFLPGRGPDNVIVQLELKDPLLLAAPSSSSSARSAASLTRGRSSSLPSVRRSSGGGISGGASVSTATPAAKRLPSLSSSSAHLPGSSIGKRKRPWFVTGTSGGGGIGNLRRRRSSLKSTAPTLTNDDGLVGGLHDRSRGVTTTVLKILVDPRLPQLDAVVVDSFVTVIGTMITATSMDDDEDANLGGGASIPPDSSAKHGNDTKHAIGSQSHCVVHKLEARLVQSVPKDQGTDMTLLRMALEERRRMVYQKYCQQRKGQDHPNQSSVGGKNAVFTKNEISAEVFPLQGCGPPPYDRFNDDTVFDS